MSQAFIHESAKIAQGVTIGPFSYIGENVEIGEGTVIDPNVVIFKNTIIGKNNRIHSFATVGGDSQDLKYTGYDSWLRIGDNNIIHENVTINRGSDGIENLTMIGNSNCFFACAHIAHDVRIGNHVLFVNNAVVAGHVTIDDHAIIGAHASVHQFTRIGAHAFLAHATQVPNDIPPYMLVTGTPGVPMGLNLVGLRRHGFSSETITGLKKAYRLIYREGLSLEDLKLALADLAVQVPEVNLIIELMSSSKRGLLRRRNSDQS